MSGFNFCVIFRPFSPLRGEVAVRPDEESSAIGRDFKYQALPTLILYPAGGEGTKQLVMFVSAAPLSRDSWTIGLLFRGDNRFLGRFDDSR